MFLLETLPYRRGLKFMSCYISYKTLMLLKWVGNKCQQHFNTWNKPGKLSFLTLKILQQCDHELIIN